MGDAQGRRVGEYQLVEEIGSDAFRLGNFAPEQTGLQFSGLVDEFAIWSVALSSDQLQEHASVVPKFFGAEHLPPLDQFPEDHLLEDLG